MNICLILLTIQNTIYILLYWGETPAGCNEVKIQGRIVIKDSIENNIRYQQSS